MPCLQVDLMSSHANVWHSQHKGSGTQTKGTKSCKSDSYVFSMLCFSYAPGGHMGRPVIGLMYLTAPKQ